MKKYLALLFLGVIVTFAVTAQSGADATGYVANLNDIVTSKDGRVDKSQAVSLVKAGHPLVLVSNNKVYFVFNTDGSYAGKNLARNASLDSEVGIVGKIKSKGGFNYIIADKFIQ